MTGEDTKSRTSESDMPEGVELGNANNVVSSDVCESLVLTDGMTFSAPQPFTATTASYARNLTSQYGTICLPYAVSSNDAVKYYSLDHIDGTTLYLTEQTEVGAGVPAVFENIGGGNTMSVTADEAAVSGTITASVSGNLQLIGSYAPLVITDADALAKSYYISGDQFRQANLSLTVNPFRAYFTCDNVAAGKTLSIANGGITGISEIPAGVDGEIAGIYDVDGVKHETLQQGINIVKYTNGKTQKVIVHKK